MEENPNPIPGPNPEPTPQPEPEHPYLARGQELIFAGAMLILSILLCNFVFYGGFHLAFGLTAAAMILCSWLYLKKSGHRFGWYEKALLILSLIICPGFGRSDDGAVKFFMLLFLFVAVNLALCIGAGQNRRNPQGAMSLLDAPRAFYRLGIGNLGPASKGMAQGFRQGGAATRRMGAVGTGLLISLPILAVMVVLLMNADAAFEGLMDLLPEFELEEYLNSACFGFFLACILYTRGISLARAGKPAAARRSGKGLNVLTVNTVLIMVCLVYVVYLLSQLAYLSGGLSGILPEEFTLAEYARRGFFEMSTLCTINLGILCFAIWLVREETLPRLTKIAGTFLGFITIFLVITASAKMFLYIGSYGLTWSRVTTEVFMLWLAVTTVLITIRLFLPKFGYMKAVALTAMILGTLVFWVDVNTLVASYNVRAYQSGKLETVDVSHISSLGSAGTPWLCELAEDADPMVAEQAREYLNYRSEYPAFYYDTKDFRSWNFCRVQADRWIDTYREARISQILAHVTKNLEIPVTSGTPLLGLGHTFVPGAKQNFLITEFTDEASADLVRQLEEAGWENLPLSPEIRTLLGGNKSLFSNFTCCYSLPTTQEGWWLFRDLHPDVRSIEQVHNRNGYHFILAWYDVSDQTLYYFEINTLKDGQDASSSAKT